MFKRVIAVTALFFSASMALAQWTTPPAASGTTPIHYDGIVGIGTGTATPAAPLHILNSSLTLPLMRLAYNDTYYMDLNRYGLNVQNQDFTISNTGVEHLRIDNSGRVGIGTAPNNTVLELKSAAVNAGIRVDGKESGAAAYFFNSQSGAGHDGATMSVNAFYDGSVWSYVNGGPSWAVQVRTYEDDFVVGRGIANSPPATTFLRINNSGNVGIGVAGEPIAKLDVNGDINISGNINAKYQDVAEWVPVTTKMLPGTVVILNGERKNEVMPSNHAYDTTVAGVVSEQPGLILGEASDSKAKIATTGRVKVRVDATKHPVKIGDLLVTGDKTGVAMVSEPIDLGGVKIHRPGTLLGRALEPLANGDGEILVLLALQ